MRTAQREVFEETGVRVQIVGFLGMWLDEYDDQRNGAKRTLNIYYHAVPSGPISGALDTAEVAELGLFSASELPDQLAFPGHVPAALHAWKRAASAGEFATSLFDWPANMRIEPTRHEL